LPISDLRLPIARVALDFADCVGFHSAIRNRQSAIHFS